MAFTWHGGLELLLLDGQAKLLANGGQEIVQSPYRQLQLTPPRQLSRVESNNAKVSTNHRNLFVPVVYVSNRL